jgi:hypothetical protein
MPVNESLLWVGRCNFGKGGIVVVVCGLLDDPYDAAPETADMGVEGGAIGVAGVLLLAVGGWLVVSRLMDPPPGTNPAGMDDDPADGTTPPPVGIIIADPDWTDPPPPPPLVVVVSSTAPLVVDDELADQWVVIKNRTCCNCSSFKSFNNAATCSYNADDTRCFSSVCFSLLSLPSSKRIV